MRRHPPAGPPRGAAGALKSDTPGDGGGRRPAAALAVHAAREDTLPSVGGGACAERARRPRPSNPHRISRQSRPRGRLGRALQAATSYKFEPPKTRRLP